MAELAGRRCLGSVPSSKRFLKCIRRFGHLAEKQPPLECLHRWPGVTTFFGSLEMWRAWPWGLHTTRLRQHTFFLGHHKQLLYDANIQIHTRRTEAPGADLPQSIHTRFGGSAAFFPLLELLAGRVERLLQLGDLLVPRLRLLRLATLPQLARGSPQRREYGVVVGLRTSRYSVSESSSSRCTRLTCFSGPSGEAPGPPRGTRRPARSSARRI